MNHTPTAVPALPSTTQLPPLPDADASLLDHLIRLKFCIETLALETFKSVVALLQWASRPDIQAYIECARNLDAAAHQRKLRAAVDAALQGLAHLINTTYSAQEFRRASALLLDSATTLLRIAAKPNQAPRTPKHNKSALQLNPPRPTVA